MGAGGFFRKMVKTRVSSVKCTLKMENRGLERGGEISGEAGDRRRVSGVQRGAVPILARKQNSYGKPRGRRHTR